MAIVRNIENGQFYRYHGNDIYENVITGIKGRISPTAAAKNLKINLEATQLFNEYPIVEEMVRRLNLVLENQSK